MAARTVSGAPASPAEAEIRFYARLDELYLVA